MIQRQLVLCSLAVFCLAQLSAQSTAGILDPTRSINWSNAGVPGGIPNRGIVCAAVDPAKYGTGTLDATAAIQNALNGCAANQVVYLGPGRYLITGGISVPSNVTLRGAGAPNTILDAQGIGAAAVISLGASATPLAANSTAITGGATAGSSAITVAGAGAIAVGSYLLITELNDPRFVTIVGNQGSSCTWCDSSLWGGARALGQLVEVRSVNGDTVGIAPALYLNYPLTPLATWFSAGAKYAGVEELQVYANNTGYHENFLLNACAYCWVKGVEGNYTDGDHVEALWSYRGEIRDSYFHDAFNHTPGNTDADVFIASESSGMLVENNIFQRLHVSVMLNWGAAGNVIAYNYSSGNFDAVSTNVLMMDLAVHGAHPMFNLWEGNIAASLHPDDTWGSSSHNTAFRNWLKGTTTISNPLTGRGTITGGWWAVQANRAVSLDSEETYYNFVGNVIGSSDMANLKKYNGSTPLLQVPLEVAPANRSYDSAAYGFTFGYGAASDTGTWSGDTISPYTTALLHGNYNNVDGSVSWDAATPDHNLPASFYLSAKPAWWGAMAWPAIGPDVTGGPGPGGHAYGNPAQGCSNGTALDSSGRLNFNARTCYPGNFPSRLIPPARLTVTIH